MQVFLPLRSEATLLRTIQGCCMVFYTFSTPVRFYLIWEATLSLIHNLRLKVPSDYNLVISLYPLSYWFCYRGSVARIVI